MLLVIRQLRYLDFENFAHFPVGEVTYGFLRATHALATRSTPANEWILLLRFKPPLTSMKTMVHLAMLNPVTENFVTILN